ncbi:MAG TPA: hypothetical protein VF903_08330, partial [Nitrospirota bacterium]
ESGGIGWAAPEIIGEIVCADPEKFADVVPLIAEIYDVEEDVFRSGVIYALARVAEIDPERVTKYQKIIVKSLADKDPVVRINALELVEYLWPVACRNNNWSKEYCSRVMNYIVFMENDNKVAWIYKNSGFIDYQVGEVAKKIAKKIVNAHMS